MIGRRAKIAAFVASALGVALPRIALADCKSDIECKGDRVCEAGSCVDPKTSTPASPAEVPPVTEAPPPPAKPTVVGVDFDTRDSKESYTVTVGAEHCAVPCTLRLPPGPTEIVVSGSRSFKRPLVVEGEARESSSMKVTLRHVCVGCYVMGGILTGTGVVAAVAAIAYGTAIPNCDPYRGVYFDLCTEDKKALTVKFGVSFGVAALGLAIGVPLMLGGGSNKPVVDRVGAASASPGRTFAIAPTFSQSSGGATFLATF